MFEWVDNLIKHFGKKSGNDQTAAEAKSAGPQVVFYIAEGYNMYGELKGLLDEYVGQLLEQVRLEGWNDIAAYGFASSIEPLEAPVAGQPYHVTFPKTDIGHGSLLNPVFAKIRDDTKAEQKRWHLAIIVTDGRVSDEEAAYMACSHLPPNAYVLFVRVSDQPIGDGYLKSYRDTSNRVHVILATDDAGKPLQTVSTGFEPVVARIQRKRSTST